MIAPKVKVQVHLFSGKINPVNIGTVTGSNTVAAEMNHERSETEDSDSDIYY